MTDQELRAAIAVEVMDWYDIGFLPSGRVVAARPGVTSFVPLEVPDWPNDLDAAKALGRVLALKGIRLENAVAFVDGAVSARCLSHEALRAVRAARRSTAHA